MIAINGPGVAASFAYDGTGRRQRKTIGGISTEFVYDGLNAVRESSGGGTATLLTALGIDTQLMRTDSADSVALLSDALGSTVALTDAAGAVVTSHTFERSMARSRRTRRRWFWGPAAGVGVRPSSSSALTPRISVSRTMS